MNTVSRPAPPTGKLLSKYGLRLKSALFGAAVATLVSPIAWCVAVLANRRIHEPWSSIASVFFATPAILLVAAVVIFPSSLLLGPPLLTLANRVPRYSVSCATGLGAVLGAVVMFLLHASASPIEVRVSFELIAFGASLGATGAWFASRHLAVESGSL
jgi:hypothetical protein